MSPAFVLARRLAAERRVLIGGVSAGAAATLFLQVAMYPSIRDTFSDMSEGLPEAFTSLIGSADFASPEGFLQAEAYGTMAPILVILVAISVAASGIPGSESSGRMTMLATSSTSRRQIALGAALATAIAVTLVTFAYWLASILGSALGGLDIGLVELTAASFSLWLLGLAVGSIAFCVGAASGGRGSTIGVAATVAVASFLAYGLLPLSDRLAWGRHISLWFPYSDHQPLLTGFDFSNTIALLLVTGCGVALGVWLFTRRDLA